MHGSDRVGPVGHAVGGSVPDSDVVSEVGVESVVSNVASEGFSGASPDVLLAHFLVDSTVLSSATTGVTEITGVTGVT